MDIQKTEEAGLRCKSSKRGRVEEAGRWDWVVEVIVMLHLNTADSPLFGAIINKVLLYVVGSC